MAARRPKQIREADAPTGIANSASESDIRVNEDVVLPPPARERRAFQSLRIIAPVHQLRHGTSPNLVDAGDNQRIWKMRDSLGDVVYIVEPGGVEIPASNVSSAIPCAAEITKKISRKSRLEEREKRLQEKMLLRPEPKPRKQEGKKHFDPNAAAPRKREGVQEVVEDEDFVDESLDEDPDETPEGAEGEEAEDGIDV